MDRKVVVLCRHLQQQQRQRLDLEAPEPVLQTFLLGHLKSEGSHLNAECSIRIVMQASGAVI